MAMRIQSTTNSLIALAVGRGHNLSLRQRKKNESLLEKSGFRPFQNVIQSTTIWGSKIRFQLGIHRNNSFDMDSDCEELDEMNSDDARSSEQKDSMDLTVSVHFEMKGDGEHVMKMKGFSPSSTEEHNVERAKQMAQKAAVLFLYGEMLQEMGKKWRAQSQASDSNE